MSAVRVMRWSAVLAALWAVSACQTRTKEPPTVEHVEPELVLNHRDERLVVHGSGFGERLIADLDDPSKSRVEARYQAWVVPTEGGAEIELLEVARISDGQLEGLLRAGAAPGSFVVRVVDPWGNEVRGATFRVDAPECGADEDCDDGLACTADSCRDARCENKLTPNSCAIDGACHKPGPAPNNPCLECDPERSTTEWRPAAATVSCDDGRGCTSDDRCDGAGVCAGTSECQAPPNDCFEAAGTCAESGCQYVLKGAGAPCDDGSACTLDTTCSPDGLCGGGSWSCGSSPAEACLEVLPVFADPFTDVLLDATCTTDPDTPSTSLQASFDTEGDGTFELPFANALTHSRKYPAGVYEPHVLVRDSPSTTSWARRFLVVADPAETIVVTTTAHEVGGTPQNPGGTGLSLTEAVAYVNSLNQPRVITFAGPGTYKTGLLSLAAAESVVAGGPGVIVDFQGAGGMGSCFDLTAEDVKVVAIDFRGCSAQTIGAKASGAQVADCRFVAGSGSSGSAAKYEAPGTFGPGNHVEGFGDHALEVKSPDVVITRNHFRDNRGAIDIVSNHANTVFEFNEVIGSTDTAVEFGGGATNTRIRFNTFVGNNVAVASGNANSGEASLTHNIFTQGTACALTGALMAYSAVTPNLFFQNAGASGCAGAAMVMGNLTGDPLFHDAASFDLRLLPASPAVNVDASVTLDVNGPLPNSYDGTGADLGAHESPY